MGEPNLGGKLGHSMGGGWWCPDGATFSWSAVRAPPTPTARKDESTSPDSKDVAFQRPPKKPTFHVKPKNKSQGHETRNAPHRTARKSAYPHTHVMAINCIREFAFLWITSGRNFERFCKKSRNPLLRQCAIDFGYPQLSTSNCE